MDSWKLFLSIETKLLDPKDWLKRIFQNNFGLEKPFNCILHLGGDSTEKLWGLKLLWSEKQCTKT